MEGIERELDQLGGEDAEQAFQAMFALQKRGREVIEPLLAIIQDREKPATLRARVVDTLALTREPGVTVALLEALQDPDVQVRIHAIGALAELGDETALPALEKLAEHDGGLLIIGSLKISVQDELQQAIRQIRGREL